MSASHTEKITVTFSELCYLLFFAMMLTAKGLGLSEGALVYDLLLAGGMFFFLLKMVLTRYDRMELLAVFLLLTLTAIVYIKTGERGIVFCCAMALGCKDVSLKRIFRVGAFLLTICFFVMMALTQAGLAKGWWYVHSKGSLGYVVRWSFGYMHPNVLHTVWLLLTALWLYILPLRTRRQLWKTCGLFMLGNLYVFFYSLSYTGFLVCTFYLACNLIFISRSMRNKTDSAKVFIRKADTVINFLIPMFFPFCVIFSVAGPVLLKGRLYELADKLVHHRFVLSNYFLTTEPICLLGHRLLTTPDGNRSIDCSYTYLFVYLGVVFFVLICIGYTTLIVNALRRARYRELSILLSFTLGGVTEPFMFNTSFKNITMLFLGCWFYHCVEKLSEKAPDFWQKKTKFCLWTDKADSKATFSIPLLFHTQKPATNENKATPARTFSHRSILLSVFCTAAILGCVCYLFLAPEPKAVLISPVFCSDGYEIEPRLYSQQELSDFAQKDHVRNLTLEKENEPLAMFTGSTAKLEYVRSTVSCGLWCGLAAAGAGSLFILRGKSSSGHTKAGKQNKV